MELTAVLQFYDIAYEVARQYDEFNEIWLLGIVYMESRGDPEAYNEETRATGLMQIMPKEAGKMFDSRPTIEELKDPGTNLEWGARILAYYLQQERDMAKAIYRYTGGMCWPSYDEYVHEYWQPLIRVRAELLAALARKEETNGRLSIRHR